MDLARLKACKLLRMPIHNAFVQLVHLILDTKEHACLPVGPLAMQRRGVAGLRDAQPMLHEEKVF